MLKKLVVLFILTVTMSVVSSCSISGQSENPVSESASSVERPLGMGSGSGMMNRHHAQVPEAFLG